MYGYSGANNFPDIFDRCLCSVFTTKNLFWVSTLLMFGPYLYVIPVYRRNSFVVLFSLVMVFILGACFWLPLYHWMHSPSDPLGDLSGQPRTPVSEPNPYQVVFVESDSHRYESLPKVNISDYEETTGEYSESPHYYRVAPLHGETPCPVHQPCVKGLNRTRLNHDARAEGSSLVQSHRTEEDIQGTIGEAVLA